MRLEETSSGPKCWPCGAWCKLLSSKEGLAGDVPWSFPKKTDVKQKTREVKVLLHCIPLVQHRSCRSHRPEELLAHELCEVIEQFEMVEQNGHSDAVEPMASSRLLMRGPRIKVGIDCSVTSMRTQISPATGRMTYRGR